MITFAVAAGSERLAKSLFGADLDVLRNIPDARQIGPIVSSWADPGAQQVLASVDALVTGWGAPALSDADLSTASRLRALIHAGGSGVALLPEGFSGVSVSISALDNARPVAEWTLAMILLANKAAFESHAMYASRRSFIDREESFPRAGNRDKIVGIIGASRIGRKVIELLRPFEVRVFVYDPYLSDDEARDLEVENVSLAELCRISDVVTVHAPELPSTRHLLDAQMLGSLRDGATVINTARGSLVDQDALIVELQRGRIHAILDVAEPDVLPPASPLYELSNVFLTPHMAGSTGTELRRLGEHVAAELARFARGLPFMEPEALSTRPR